LFVDVAGAVARAYGEEFAAVKGSSEVHCRDLAEGQPVVGLLVWIGLQFGGDTITKIPVASFVSEDVMPVRCARGQVSHLAQYVASEHRCRTRRILNRLVVERSHVLREALAEE
jgi:hypothetical protein